jgi:predicted nucleic acid-binding protein
MGYLIDSSLWVDLTRRRTPTAIREQARAWIIRAGSHWCEPVYFEVMRYATEEERRSLPAYFHSFPCYPTPENLWNSATSLGQKCRDAGCTVNPLDLLISALALAHDAEIVTFDTDFTLIARAERKLRVQCLTRAE